MSKSPIYRRLIGSRDWVELRNRYVAAHPYCERCEQEAGIYTPTQCVHHKVPCESAPNGNEDAMKRLMFDWDNLQSLCFNCHRYIHVNELGSMSKAIRERTNENNLKSFINKFL